MRSEKVKLKDIANGVGRVAIEPKDENSLVLHGGFPFC